MTWSEIPATESLSKTTKLILLDSLLQEVCIRSGLSCWSPLNSLSLSVCLGQSQPSFFRTKESPLNLMKKKLSLPYVDAVFCLSVSQNIQITEKIKARFFFSLQFIVPDWTRSPMLLQVTMATKDLKDHLKRLNLNYRFV